MGQAWRIVKEKYAATAFSGEGAARTGGRWNSRGMRVVYASSTRALAALETLVHLNPPVELRYMIIPIKFGGGLMEKLPPTTLPVNWRAEPAPASTQAIGDRWLREGRSVLLAVPSVIMPDELNYLINPAHAAFRKLMIGTPTPFTFDPRLLS